jgi:hypothetical protein
MTSSTGDLALITSIWLSLSFTKYNCARGRSAMNKLKPSISESCLEGDEKKGGRR